MRYAPWASLVVCLGLAWACGPVNGQSGAAGGSSASQTPLTESSALLAPGERVETATLVLQDENGACVKAGPLGPIYTKKGRTVQWFIQNNCKEPLDLRVANFTTKPGGSAFDPFSKAPAPCHADPGRLCTPIMTGVVGLNSPTGGAGAWVFTYDILDGAGHVIDPEIVIEWF